MHRMRVLKRYRYFKSENTIYQKSLKYDYLFSAALTKNKDTDTME